MLYTLNIRKSELHNSILVKPIINIYVDINWQAIPVTLDFKKTVISQENSFAKISCYLMTKMKTIRALQIATLL